MKRRGVTLMELLIAVTLLSLLSVAMFTALRIGLNAYAKANDKLMTNRRVAGAQRVILEEVEGIMPVLADCHAGEGRNRAPFFQGEPDTMRLVSTFSLQQGWRGQPQILEMFVIPGEREGVRLVVNEIPYSGPFGAGQFCAALHKFLPVKATPQSFVLADRLAYCRFAYLWPPKDANTPQAWHPVWTEPAWPLAVRIEMAPLQADASRVQNMTVTAPIYLHRNPEIQYGDF
jgi:prepilin-type N-terminal cleavage/methylation domain-containing protein